MRRAVHVAKLAAYSITVTAGVLVMLILLILAILGNRGGGGQ